MSRTGKLISTSNSFELDQGENIMCGIVGLLVKKPALREQLGKLMVPMLIGMTDRGPDSAGLAVFADPLKGAARKLSLYSGLTEAGADFDWHGLTHGLKEHLGVPSKIDIKHLSLIHI